MGRPGGTSRYVGLNARAAVATFSDVQRTDGLPSDGGKLFGGAPRRDGSKTLARVEARMDARARVAELRNAIDLIRREELRENVEQRRARQRQRRWYILGRALEEVMARDAEMQTAIVAALNEIITRPEERALFSFDSGPNDGW